MKRIWDDYVPQDMRQLYEEVGFGVPVGFGKRPAMLLIDMAYNTIGDKPEPVRESIKKYPWSCGETGWAAVPKIKELQDIARTKSVPVIYTTMQREPFEKDVWKVKTSSRMKQSVSGQQAGTQFVAEIAPQEKDIIIVKKRSSAFFGTALVSFLNHFQVDTLLIMGGALSSCVRATVIDSNQYNYHTILVEECVFDRHPLIYAVELFDMNAKFGDVVSFESAKNYLKSL